MNDLEVDPARYSLVFEGVSDDNPETLQKLKGVFIADLDFSVPEVQAILDLGKGVVCSSDDEAELKQKFLLLQKAGANVHIVVPHSLTGAELEVKETDADLNAEQIEPELINQDGVSGPDFAYAVDHTDQHDETFADGEDLAELDIAADEEDDQDFADEEDEDEVDEEDEGFELELSFDEMFETSKPEPKKKRTTVHVINDESLSLDDTLSELGIEAGESVPPTAAKATNAAPSSESDIPNLSLDLAVPLEDESPATQSSFAAPAVPDTSALSFDSTEGAGNTDVRISESSPADTPRVNEKGIIPETAIGVLPLFELASMDEAVGEPVPSGSPVETPATEDASSLFADLTLAEPVESEALLEPGVNDNTLGEEFDLSLGRDSVAPEQPEEAPLPQPVAMQIKTAAAPKKEESVEVKSKPADTPASEGLFSGLDLDSVMESVVDSASADLKKAGIAAEVEQHKKPATSTLSLAGSEPETAAKPKKVARPEIEGEHEQEPLVVSNKDPELRTHKKNSPALKRDTIAKQDASDGNAAPVKAKPRLPVDVILVVVIGIAVLGVGNWLYFKGSIEANELEQSRIQMELARVHKEEKALAKAREELPQAGKVGAASAKNITFTSEYVGRYAVNGLHVSARARVQGGEVELVEFSIRTPEPRELTDMEIVEKKQKLPWLAKVAVDPVLLPLSEENALSEKVTIKSFIEDNYRHTRLLASGVLNATHFPEDHRLELSLQVTEGPVPVEPFNQFSIERVDAGKYNYAASGKVMLQAVPAKDQ